jgi:hypothetical protein
VGREEGSGEEEEEEESSKSPDLVLGHVCNPSTQKAEAGGSTWAP